ncbi:MAG: calcium/sodium antiporter [Nitratireductor sp.]|nr:calcium/sodium antiporter [Nitratireductor sp.]
MMYDLALVVTGLLALLLGGEMLLRGAVDMATRLKLSQLVIGLTVVGFGTSMPELLVSVKAALSGQQGIAIGNVVGSNIANILLIGGIAALVHPPSAWDKSIKRDAIAMVAASFLLLALAMTGSISGLTAAVMLTGLCIYLAMAYHYGRIEPEEGDTPPATVIRNSWIPVGLLLIGFAALFLGADWLVNGASGLARDFGVSEAVIGLTIVAVGTSLPELATSILAALRRNTDVALGNIVGSNIFNILGILGVTGIIAPLGIDDAFLMRHIPIMLGVTVLFGIVLVCARTLPRLAGLSMLTVYAAYSWSLYAG